MQASFALCPCATVCCCWLTTSCSTIFEILICQPLTLPLTDSPWGVIDPSPMCYRNLAPQALASELRHLSAARTIGTTHCVTFQPCLEAINQDRYDVQEWTCQVANGPLLQFSMVAIGADSFSTYVFMRYPGPRRGKNR